MTVSESPRSGSEAAHAKLEAKYAAALEAGKGNQYYLGMGAITGTPRMVFLSGYASLAEMAAVHNQDEGALGDKLASLDEQHSATVAKTETALWRLRPELSNPGVENLASMRYMDLVHIHVKLGHSEEFASVIKSFRAGWLKAHPDFHYSLYQQIYGGAMDDSYMMVIAVRSLADLDKHHSLVTEYHKALDEDARKHMHDFESAYYDSIESNLFAFTPSMSRLPHSWTKEDADFWNLEPAADASARTAGKAN